MTTPSNPMPARGGDGEERERTIRYRTLPSVDGEKPQRVRVVWHRGWEGYAVRWTDHCSGCTDYGDYGTVYGPNGCEECGYTGKRRREQWIPFDHAAWEAHRDRVWARYERFCGFIRQRREASHV